MSERQTRPNVRKMTGEERWLIWRGRTRWVLRGLVAVALVVGSGLGANALYNFVMTSPHLRVRHVEVLGAERANAEEVELLAGDVRGLHILDVDTRLVAASVVKHPWVAWAEVRRRLPDGLSIEVLERQPAALLMAGELYLVDRAGSPFKKVGPGDPLDLPVLTGFDDSTSPLRTDGALGRRAVNAAIGLIEALARAGYDPETISEVHLDANQGYSVFFTHGGAQVVLGWDSFEVKLARLGKLERTQGLQLTHVARVDLDLDRAAVVTSLAGVMGAGL